MSGFLSWLRGEERPRGSGLPDAPDGAATAPGRAGEPAPLPDTPPQAPSRDAEPAELERRLTDLVARVNRAGGRMPEGAVPAVRDVEDVLRPLLRYLRTNPATEQEMIPVRATVTDYLPTTVDTFLALPPQFASTHRNRQGRTPVEELLEQLRLLTEGAEDYANAIYAGDAQELSNQGRFLQTKFSRSDLDL